MHPHPQIRIAQKGGTALYSTTTAAVSSSVFTTVGVLYCFACIIVLLIILYTAVAQGTEQEGCRLRFTAKKRRQGGAVTLKVVSRERTLYN